MLRKIGSVIVIGIALFAVYKWFGGDIAAFLGGVWDIFYQIIDSGSDIVINGIRDLTSST